VADNLLCQLKGKFRPVLLSKNILAMVVTKGPSQGRLMTLNGRLSQTRSISLLLIYFIPVNDFTLNFSFFFTIYFIFIECILFRLSSLSGNQINTSSPLFSPIPPLHPFIVDGIHLSAVPYRLYGQVWHWERSVTRKTKNFSLLYRIAVL
jgi:hypothetical protein